jgi:hypothetical protein
MRPSEEKQFYGTGDDTLLGPERAMGIVRSEDSQTGWASGSEGGNFQVVEPIPVVIDDQLWWHSKVVPIDQTDVTRNVFVNAHEGEAVELHHLNCRIHLVAEATSIRLKSL